MTNTTSRVFEYAIKFPNGTYYTSGALEWEYHVGKSSPENIKNSKRLAYTFTEKGAHSAILRSPEMFKGCTVEHLL
jgi:hypothetical protein